MAGVSELSSAGEGENDRGAFEDDDDDAVEEEDDLGGRPESCEREIGGGFM